MAARKIAITLDPQLLREVDDLVEQRRFASRSQAIHVAVKEKLDRLSRRRLAEECAKLDPKAEQALAEEGIAPEADAWPEY
jgi:Arc/MetJ-type ribon-helix-helix transcriptional regulator